ncbi:hypothetical protein [Streptococcus lactarius]|uniref:hypothetical protein n=1 Tax=Streptococcus lactarius TaxID=684066 RepID=UPI00360FDC8B
MILKNGLKSYHYREAIYFPLINHFNIFLFLCIFLTCGILSITRDKNILKTLDYYTVDKFFKNLYDRKSLLKRGRILKKYTISRKQTLTLASVVLGTVFTGTTIASADDVAPSTTQAAPAATTAAKSPITAATEEINAKANTPVVPADKAKTGDVIAVDVQKQDQLRKQTVQIQPLPQQQLSKRLA